MKFLYVEMFKKKYLKYLKKNILFERHTNLFRVFQ